jgi:hypothetical protein
MFNGTWIWVFVPVALIAGFSLPIVIGLVRKVERMDLVVLFDFLGLVTAGAGWLAAMLLACMMPRRPPRYVMPPTAEPAEVPWHLQNGTEGYPRPF